jgi:hypothetical protein
VTDPKESQVKDNFSTFLRKASNDWAQQTPSSADEVLPAPEDTSAVPDAATSGTASAERPPAPEPVDLRMQLVTYLAENGPAPIADIQSTFGLGFTEIGPLVLKLEAAGLIQMSGQPGVEVVGLTPQGKELA